MTARGFHRSGNICFWDGPLSVFSKNSSGESFGKLPPPNSIKALPTRPCSSSFFSESEMHARSVCHRRSRDVNAIRSDEFGIRNFGAEPYLPHSRLVFGFRNKCNQDLMSQPMR